MSLDDHDTPFGEEPEAESEPHARAAEQAFLGAVLTSPIVLDSVHEHLDGADFYEPRHETIWHAILDLHRAGIPPDAVTVGSRLMQTGAISRVGGAPYLHTLVATCPNPAIATTYATHVQQAARARAAANLGRKITHLASSAGPDSLATALSEGVQLLEQLAERVGPSSRRAALDDLFLTRSQLSDLPQVRQLIDGVVPRDAYGILRGRDHTFKTFIALDWALSIATGRTWQGHHVAQPGRVLYVVGEGVYGIEARIVAWEKAWGLTIPDDHFTTRRAALNFHRPGDDYQHLLQHTERAGYDLIVIDTLRRISGAADGNGPEMGPVIDNIDRLRRATNDGSVLVLAHTDKGDNDSRGFSGIEDDADFIWHAKRHDNTPNLRLEHKKNKNGPEGSTIELRASACHGSLVLEGTTPAPSSEAVFTENHTRITRTLRETFPDGATPSQIHEDSAVAKSSLYRTLADLQRKGHIVNTATPKRPFWVLSSALQLIEDESEIPTPPETNDSPRLTDPDTP